jgi:hypothetical protein
MPINIISLLKPKNDGTFPIAEDVDGYGGYQVRSDIDDRNGIPSLNRKEGMLVYVQEDDKYYTLNGGTTDGYWIEVILGGDGYRQIVILDEPTTYNVLSGVNYLIINTYDPGGGAGVFSTIMLPTNATEMQEIIFKTRTVSKISGSYIRVDGNTKYIDQYSYVNLNPYSFTCLKIRWTNDKWSVVCWTFAWWGD